MTFQDLMGPLSYMPVLGTDRSTWRRDMAAATGTVTEATPRHIVEEGTYIGIIQRYIVGKVIPIHIVKKDTMEKEISVGTITKDTTLEDMDTNLTAETTTAKATHIDILTRNTGIIMATATSPGGIKGLTFFGKYR